MKPVLVSLGILLWSVSQSFAGPLNMITFDNRSGKSALVVLEGPTRKAIEVPNDQRRTVNVTGGQYAVIVRYGDAPREYRYSKGETFHVTQTASRPPVITVFRFVELDEREGFVAASITLHRVVGGNYASQPISAEEFERAVARSGQQPREAAPVQAMPRTPSSDTGKTVEVPRAQRDEVPTPIERPQPLKVPIAEAPVIQFPKPIEMPRPIEFPKPIEMPRPPEVPTSQALGTRRPTLTLVNQSAMQALVRVKGPKNMDVEVAPSARRTVSILGGDYSVKIRLGTDEGSYTYSRGDSFHVTDTKTRISRTTITFNAPSGNYRTQPISKEEFWK